MLNLWAIISFVYLWEANLSEALTMTCLDRSIAVWSLAFLALCLCVCYISLMQWEHQCVQANPSKPKGYKIFSKMVNWTERSKSVRVNAHTPACLTTNYGLYAANEIDSRHLIMDKLIVTKSVDTHKKNRRTRAHDKHSNQIKIQQIHSNPKPHERTKHHRRTLFSSSSSFSLWRIRVLSLFHANFTQLYAKCNIWLVARSFSALICSILKIQYRTDKRTAHTIYTSHSPKYKHFTSTLMMLRNEYEPLTQREKLNS